MEAEQQLYEQALALDPDFALAHAALSMVHGLMWQLRFDPSPARVELQREEAEAARRLDPDLPQVHLALCILNFEDQLEEVEIALQGLPNDAEAWGWLVAAHRTLGNADQAIAAFDSAVRLDPRNVGLWIINGGVTFWMFRRYPEAVRALDRAAFLAPGIHLPAMFKGEVYLVWRGEVDTLRAALDALPVDQDLTHYGSTVAARAKMLLLEGQGDSLLSVLARTRRVVLDPESQFEFFPTSLYAAWAHQLLEDSGAARTAFDSALQFLDSVLTVPDRDADWLVHAARGLALAGLGQRDDALKEDRWLARFLEESTVYHEYSWPGVWVVESRARILAQAGYTSAALDEIERLLAGPSLYVSAYTLRMDPRYDPISDDPRFQALLVKYAEPQPVH